MELKELKSLKLAVKRSAWRQVGYYESTSENWSKVRAAILDRDGHTCVYCGFACQKFQEVHHIDGDHDNNFPENLVTACSFCHATQHIGLAGKEGRGQLIWLPEMSQAALNHAVRWLEVGPYSKPDVITHIQAPKETLLRFFKSRIDVCAKKFGSADPSSLAKHLMELTDAQYDSDVSVRLSPVRLFPVVNSYSPEQRAGWSEQLTILIPESGKVTPYLQAGAKRNVPPTTVR
jgi:intracellular multiplication protein IcmJ